MLIFVILSKTPRFQCLWILNLLSPTSAKYDIAVVCSAWVVIGKMRLQFSVLVSYTVTCPTTLIKRFTKRKYISIPVFTAARWHISSCLSIIISVVYNVLDTVWVTWLCLITSVVSLVVLILVKQRFTRLDLEEEDNSTTPDTESSSSYNKSAW